MDMDDIIQPALLVNTESAEADRLHSIAANPAYTLAQDFTETPFESTLAVKYDRVAHCMIYAKWSDPHFKLYHPPAAILMQIREDGFLGFPGGLVDVKEDIVIGLNRELKEEINLNEQKHTVTLEDHIVSHIHHPKKFICHFFALEVTLEEFKRIEKECLDARDYGSEVMGITRVPLYTMQDNYRGFPAFLKNNFVGNSKQQLCKSLETLNILGKHELCIATANSMKANA